MKDNLFNIDFLYFNNKLDTIKKQKYSKDKINYTQNNNRIKTEDSNYNTKQNTPKYDKIKNKTEKIHSSNSKTLSKFPINQDQIQNNRNKNDDNEIKVNSVERNGVEEEKSSDAKDDEEEEEKKDEDVKGEGDKKDDGSLFLN